MEYSSSSEDDEVEEEDYTFPLKEEKKIQEEDKRSLFKRLVADC